MPDPDQHSGTEQPERQTPNAWKRGVVIAITAVTVAVITLFGFYRFVGYYERGAELYVAKEVVPFIETWEWDVFRSLVPPSRHAIFDSREEFLREFCDQLSQVGLPTHLDAPEGYVTLAFDSGIIPSVAAFVQVNGEFPTGPASIEITLLREERSWFLNHVSVKSDYLLEMLAD